MRPAFWNYIGIAVAIIACAVSFEGHIQQQGYMFLFIGVLLIAGFVFIPVVNCRAALRHEQFENIKQMNSSENK